MYWVLGVDMSLNDIVNEAKTSAKQAHLSNSMAKNPMTLDKEVERQDLRGISVLS